MKLYSNHQSLKRRLGTIEDTGQTDDNGQAVGTQHVTVDNEMPLPTGAATEATLSLLRPIVAAEVCTPTDGDGGELVNVTRGLMVNVAGDIKVQFAGGGDNIILTLLPGIIYPFYHLLRVYETGTTATGITLFY